MHRGFGKLMVNIRHLGKKELKRSKGSGKKRIGSFELDP